MLKAEKRPLPIVAYNRLANIIGFSKKIDFDKIIQKARRNTRLHDFGEDFNETSLKKLVISANTEAQLHPFGEIMLREKLISQLENRLWAEHWFKKYPEILESELLPVILVTGMQRTGTTKMQRQLSGLPGARGLLSWEALYPAPLGKENETNKRIARTERNEKAVRWISPTFQAIHPIHTDQPEEDVLLLDVHFMSSSMEAILNVPSYARWLSEQDHTEAYNYEKKLLKLLQWQKGGKFWVLKSPHHLEYLDKVDKVFPGTELIWMHRPIEDCIPSFLSMLYYSRSMFSDQVDQQAIVDQWLSKLSDMLQSGLDFRIKNPKKIRDVFFMDFLKNEQKAIQELVKGIPFIENEDKISNEETGARYVSKHKYKLQDWELDIEALHARFNFYHQAIFGA